MLKAGKRTRIALLTTLWAVLLCIGFAGAQYQPVGLWTFDGTTIEPTVDGAVSLPGGLAVTGDIDPAANKTYALGSSSLLWNEGWTETTYANQLDANAAGGMSIGGTNATSILVATSGVDTTFQGGVFVEELFSLQETTAPVSETADHGIVWAQSDGGTDTDLWLMTDDPAGGTAVQWYDGDVQGLGGTATNILGNSGAFGDRVSATGDATDPALGFAGSNDGFYSAGASSVGVTIDGSSALTVSDTAVLPASAGGSALGSNILPFYNGWFESSVNLQEETGISVTADECKLNAVANGADTDLYVFCDDGAAGSNIQLTNAGSAAGGGAWADAAGPTVVTNTANASPVPNSGTATIGLTGDRWDTGFFEQILVSDGSAGAPGFAFADGTNTGLTRWAAGSVAMVAGGSFTSYWDSFGFYPYTDSTEGLGSTVRKWVTVHTDSLGTDAEECPVAYLDSVEMSASGDILWETTGGDIASSSVPAAIIYVDRIDGTGPDCWEATFNNEGTPFTSTSTTYAIPTGLSVTPGAGEFNTICTAELNSNGGGSLVASGLISVNAVDDATTEVRRSLAGGGGEFGSWTTQGRVTTAAAQVIACEFARDSGTGTLEIAHAKLSVCETYAAN